VDETAYLTGANGQAASDEAFSWASTWAVAREQLIQAAITLSASKRNALNPAMVEALASQVRGLQAEAHKQLPGGIG
jgi:enoyl-CoA hydratase/carnithine racemase